ncbi:hypothetical protein [Chryseobacterium sp. Bi04]|nr:hypothetical protein [Chryseobacterium sp. Bi04]
MSENLFTGVKAGQVRNWVSFYGKNAVWFGGAKVGVGNELIYNGTHK